MLRPEEHILMILELPLVRHFDRQVELLHGNLDDVLIVTLLGLSDVRLLLSIAQTLTRELEVGILRVISSVARLRRRIQLLIRLMQHPRRLPLLDSCHHVEWALGERFERS